MTSGIASSDILERKAMNSQQMSSTCSIQMKQGNCKNCFWAYAAVCGR